MKKAEYHAYLKSDLWLVIRDAILEFYGNRCALCNEGWFGLEVHHRTYERIGHELPTDLIALCTRCHKTHHGHMAVLVFDPEPEIEEPRVVKVRRAIRQIDDRLLDYEMRRNLFMEKLRLMRVLRDERIATGAA